MKFSFRNSRFEIRYSKKGFSLVEMLFFVAILTIALVAMVQTLIVMTRSFRTLQITERIGADATFALERMVREIRDAESVSDGGSTFGAHPGRLLLNTTDSAGVAKTVEFFLSNGRLSLNENGTLTGALTGDATVVSNLVFRKVSTSHSQGVKIELTMTGASNASSSEQFFTTAVLRNSY